MHDLDHDLAANQATAEVQEQQLKHTMDGDGPVQATNANLSRT